MITALVLAAGLSRRMDAFKLLLPWRGNTVVGQVVDTLCAAGLADILVVTGHRAADVSAAIGASAARPVFNPRYADGEMLSSIQTGLAVLAGEASSPPAALICLGDQPQMQVSTVQSLLAAGAACEWQRILIPSYDMHAGHPIILPKHVWPDVLATGRDLRTVLAGYSAEVDYITVETPSILADLDTPEDYRREQVQDGN